MNILLIVTVMALGIARLTLILSRDKITEPIRERIKPEHLRELIECPDCLGVWVALLSLVAFYYLPLATFCVMLVLSASMITSLLARLY